MMRILGLDFGTRRVGAALSDPGGTIATPLEIYERKDPVRDARHYRALVEAQEVGRVVVGLPLHTGGGEGTLAELARQWGRWLGEATGLDVVFFDERYTTYDAEEILRAAGVRLPKRKGKRDMLAAQIMLQNYLDAGAPIREAPAAPLEDARPESGADAPADPPQGPRS